MSSNVGLSTPERNTAFIKPRNQGYGAPYPPVSGANGPVDRAFKQRLPDKQILEHDRRRAIEVKVMEERERLEEENERLEEEAAKGKATAKGKSEAKEDGEADEEARVLSEEEIDERCEALRQKLVKEMEEGREAPGKGGKDRRGLKGYQVHELAEAKIQESERLRRALGIREDRETGEISSTRGERRREKEREE
ncbi:mRNA splicing factor Cwf21 [Penicillium macrosclerotiorum]|uniref:mRNA splicing factor Cwf21 n=1 Tax=Penicillium macrosclerotiorum TaxID=303699 RepID=UPI002548D27F|nr:mRNA splicing factor Cwf21 [Penicillium macrosclerotiorum]KAJ5669306.1 mRNA splicing factor Cwf21 [Penicillium macrosclerotiorum]